ncbi:hypothetical protein [Ruegeria faecimaris]|uniref:Uncharacterized protein n=1 Tax=Ruegeria faecimaris TaxID=686389 RepID=A0A521B2P7_9RHOB|nr:hypothetical protein [Ruegeria faecimaris]SMO41357.1 hypothetical protein SAMN06265380_101505 [Ruegeria faecimaris]
MTKLPESAKSQNPSSLTRRIEELRAKPATDISHGEALLLQGNAISSLREQRLARSLADFAD